MKFNVTEVEFDFDDDYAEESKLTFDEEIEIRDLALGVWAVSYTHLRAHETEADLVCRLLLEKKKAVELNQI